MNSTITNPLGKSFLKTKVVENILGKLQQMCLESKMHFDHI